jgi:hypothetical protein
MSPVSIPLNRGDNNVDTAELKNDKHYYSQQLHGTVT